MKHQHRGLLKEIQTTMERFFTECLSSLLVVIYVLFEAAGCVEGMEDGGGADLAECQPYFFSARTFATAMSAPLVLYVASFVADLSTYDILIGQINKTLACGFFSLLIAGGLAVASFAIRTWTYVNYTPIFYSELFLVYWEVFLYFSQILVVQGVLHDFDNQQHMEKEEKHRHLAKEMRHIRERAMKKSNSDETGKEVYDTEETGRRMVKIRKLFADEVGDGDADDFLENARSKFTVASTKTDEDSTEREKEDKLVCCWLYEYQDPNADIAHPFGVHYRATRGTQISSNWMGLII